MSSSHLSTATRYAAALGIGSLAGIVGELVNNPNHWCLTNPGWKSLIACTVGNMYGWGAVAAVILFDLMGGINKWGPFTATTPSIKIPMLLQILVVTVCATAVEAVGSRVSLLFHNGKQTWKYPDSWIPALGGSISLVSSAYFGFAIFLFYCLVYLPLLL